MGVYDRQIATALRLIKAKGQVVTWRKLDDGAPADSSKPWKPSAATPDDNTVSIVFLPPTKENKQLIRYLKGTEVPTGSLDGLMHAVSFEPAAKDIVIRDGKELVIKSIDPLSPNGEVILYFLEFEA